jgi:hypothetical protein
MSEQIEKTGQTNDESELKASLNRIENQSNEQTPTEVKANINDTPSFNCPDFVLDFLQDKPIAIQKIILTSKLTQSEKKEVESIFLPNEHELKINRAAIKSLVEKLATKYPEMQAFLTNETIFYGTFAFGFYDRSVAVKEVLEIRNQKSN